MSVPAGSLQELAPAAPAVDPDGAGATPDRLPRTPADAPGYPARTPPRDLAAAFAHPPRGYGGVPFYWWSGPDELTRERLRWQLDQLEDAGVQGFAVSYNHTHSEVDVEANAGGHGVYGITDAGVPRVFSEPWWEIWDWFAGECAKRDMGVGLDDYTFGTPGNRWWPDEIAALPELGGYPSLLKLAEPVPVRGPREVALELPRDLVSLQAYRSEAPRDHDGIDLLPLVESGRLEWKAPAGTWTVYPVSQSADTWAPVLHPESGSQVIQRFFDRFERHTSPRHRRALNYFFQDELQVRLEPGVWSHDFPEQFRARKGYDIRPYLAALEHDLGPRTAKLRLDYADVAMALAEERYFRPIFLWHWTRGRIWGSDNWGRGLVPDRYLDYFRATRWFSAPGNDAPRRGLALVQTKVSSSISHLYGRPRVWLEAFHSMGWNAQPSELLRATELHYLLGGNLLCLHGLYYSTHGSHWEWAPPDFHFRMPYWPHMASWLRSIERLSFLLSQGTHVADVAVVYPVSPLHALPASGAGAQREHASFEVAQDLFDAGIDFDFIDYQSLKRARASDGCLEVSGECYRALVLADLPVARFSTLERALELFEAGGAVVAAGRLPAASDRIGAGDPELDGILERLFGTTADAATAAEVGEASRSRAGGIGVHLGSDPAAVTSFLSGHLARDFRASDGEGRALHRRIGDRDVYMLMDVTAGQELFLRARGRVELWDQATGTIRLLPVLRQSDEGTWLRFRGSSSRSRLVVFSPGTAVIEDPASEPAETEVESRPLTGPWRAEPVPTLDNRFGDFRLPATDEKLGVEARRFRYRDAAGLDDDWVAPGYDDGDWQRVTHSFGPMLWTTLVPGSTDFERAVEAALAGPDSGARVEIDGESFEWRSYPYSRRWGVEGEPGSQGYHGLKGRVSDDFLIMGESGHHFFKSWLAVEGDREVELEVGGRLPDLVAVDGRVVDAGALALSGGLHSVLLGYRDVPGAELSTDNHPVDRRVRSSVLFYEAGAERRPPQPLAMGSYRQPGQIPYDALAGRPATGAFRFTAPGGLEKLELAAYGGVRVWVDGREATLESAGEEPDGRRHWVVTPVRVAEEPATVAMLVEHRPGYYGGAAVPEPIALTCGEGRIPAGSWSSLGVLEDYSGGMWYRRTVELTPSEVAGRVHLDLGEVVATCEVWVDDERVGELIGPPYSIDISDHVRVGPNTIAVLVYSTLSNHYQTIPTPASYKLSNAAGLLGPVFLRFER